MAKKHGLSGDQVSRHIGVYKAHGLMFSVIVAMGPNADAGVGQRLVSEEPMYLIVNLGLSENFGAIEWVSRFQSLFLRLITPLVMTVWRVSGLSRKPC